MSIAEKLQTIAENEQRVYDAGYAKGQAEGGDTTATYDEGFEAGKKSEYDRFWDAYQNNGNRTVYEFAFAGKGWTDETFCPKYDLILNATYATQMFHTCYVTDLVAILNKQGIKLDVSGCKNFSQFAQSSLITTFPILDFSNATGLNLAFTASKAKTIEKIICSENTVFAANTFQTMFDLENVIFEGVIAKSINFQWSSKLSIASMKSTILHAKIYKGTDSEYKNSIIFNDNCWIALEADSTAPDGGTWKNYVYNVLGWGY